MRYLALIVLTLMSMNSHSQLNLFEVDRVVINRKYKSTDVKELSKEIALDFKSDSNKIRAFYIYVVNNIEYDITLSKRVWHPRSQEDMDSITQSEINKCIRTKKGICWDYSALFQRLCFYQGIEAEQIGGTLRTGEIMPENRPDNHAWNSVVINGKRKFIDCTFVPPDEYIQAEYDKFYLVDPEEFIYRCLPIDPEKQYLKSSITYSEFKNLAYVQNAFYEHRVKMPFPNLLIMKINNSSNYLITYRINNIDRLTSIEVYINDELIQTNEEIRPNMVMNWNLRLVPGDKIKMVAVNTVRKDEYGAMETTSPILTYIAN